MFIRLPKILFLAGAVSFLLAAGAASSEVDVHPGLYITSEDVKRAKRNIERFSWARETFERIKDQADKWAGMSQDDLRAAIPPPGAHYAYGFSGCPECGASWHTWGRSGICDLRRPGVVQCPSCKKIFPDDEHPDSGEGWVDEATGNRYWFVATYNSYLAQTVTLYALDALSNAYALTDDEEYARAAAALFDGLAHVYPTCTVGSVDYPNAPGGRLERTLYQVARVLVLLARYYDLIYDSSSLDEKSAFGEMATRDHIEENILRNGAKYCYEEGKRGYCGLTNGQADYVRGVLAVGLLLEMPLYIDWALSSPYAVFNFLDNNLDHDGQYYETSAGYSQHALNLYMDMAEMLANYRSEEYPSGIDLYSHPKFSKALVQGHLDILCAGHVPMFGDFGPDWKKLEKEPFNSPAYIGAERLFRRARSPEEKKRRAGVLNNLCAGDVESARAEAPSFLRTWLLYHGEPVPKASSSENPESSRSILLDGKGIAILRSGHGPAGRAALIRYGPSVCHGHRDDLNVNFFALGRELTYDLGYYLGSAHVQKGWAHHTASHNLVVVNEKSQLQAGPSGGSAHLFADSDVLRMVEASSEASYKSEGVSLYRRTLALVDSDPGRSYLVDVFRVRGGTTHDLIWHAIGDELGVEGVSLGGIQSEGSLAGPEYDYGRRVGPDGDIIGEVDKGPYWNPPPGNGYGFLYNVQRGPVERECAAAWTVDAKSAEVFRVSFFPPPGCELITAQAPGILPKLPNARYAILRRTGSDLDSAFVSVLQPFQSANPVESALGLEVEDAESSPVGIEIGLRGGGTDYVLSAVDGSEEHHFETNGNAISLRGRFAFVRLRRGLPVKVLLLRSGSVSLGDLEVAVERPAYWGRVEDVDRENCTLVTRRELPLDGSLVGQKVYINRRDYSRKSWYGIRSVSTDGGRYLVRLDTDTLVLGRGYISAEAEPGMHELRNIVPLEKSTSCSRGNTGFFNGKLLKSADGTCAPVIDVLAAGGKKTILVPDASQFEKGQDITIYDVQAGDTFEIPTLVDLTFSEQQVQAYCTSPATLRLAGRTYQLAPGSSTVKL